MPSSELLAYLAGVIDSDGYIGLYRKRGPQRLDGRRPFYYDVKIGVNQVVRTLPDLLHETFGGSLLEFDPSTLAKPRVGSPWFMWFAYASEATAACRVLLPWLRLKHGQAKLVIEFEALKLRQLSRPSRALISPEMEEERQRLWAEVRLMNSARMGGRGV